jgi:hypothetical protein
LSRNVFQRNSMGASDLQLPYDVLVAGFGGRCSGRRGRRFKSGHPTNCYRRFRWNRCTGISISASCGVACRAGRNFGWIGSGEAARILNVKPSTVRAWVANRGPATIRFRGRTLSMAGTYGGLGSSSILMGAHTPPLLPTAQLAAALSTALRER